MKAKKALIIFIMSILIPAFLHAEDGRTVPLNLYLIIDTSQEFLETRDEILTWINGQIIDRLLQEGDSLVVWSAGETAAIVYTGTLGPDTNEAKDSLRNLDVQGTSAALGPALREANSRSTQATQANHLSMTIVVSSSTANLAPNLGGSFASLFRWSRVELHSRWQALVVDPTVDERVRNAAAAFMSGR